MTVTHLAGLDIIYNTDEGQVLRQRCSWCGAMLVDVNLDRISVPVGQEGPHPTWKVGFFVDTDAPDGRGGMWSLNEWTEGSVPETSCLRMNLELTS